METITIIIYKPDNFLHPDFRRYYEAALPDIYDKLDNLIPTKMGDMKRVDLDRYEFLFALCAGVERPDLLDDLMEHYSGIEKTTIQADFNRLLFEGYAWRKKRNGADNIIKTEIHFTEGGWYDVIRTIKN